MSDVAGSDGWPKRYPKSELMRDVEAMVEAITTGLISHSSHLISCLWLKGSAAKSWDTPIDYVPELSDVDIHYRVANRGASELADLDSAVRLHADIARRFTAARPHALHTQRPQFVSLAEVEQLVDYVPSPAGTVRTLYGDTPAQAEINRQSVRNVDAQNLISAGDPQVLEKAVIDLIEQPRRYLYYALRKLNWRLSPVASRALSFGGGLRHRLVR